MWPCTVCVCVWGGSLLPLELTPAPETAGSCLLGVPAGHPEGPPHRLDSVQGTWRVLYTGLILPDLRTPAVKSGYTLPELL